jgi:hypothetical protein
MFKKIQAIEDEDTNDLRTGWGRVLSQQERCPRCLSFRVLLDAPKYVETQKYLSSFASSHNQKEVNYFTLFKQSKAS